MEPATNTTSQTAPAFLTPREVAALLRCRRQAIYKRIASGSIPAVRLDPNAPLLVPRERLEALLQEEILMAKPGANNPPPLVSPSIAKPGTLSPPPKPPRK